MCSHAMAPMWWSKDNFVEFVRSFLQTLYCFQGQIQVTRFVWQMSLPARPSLYAPRDFYYFGIVEIFMDHATGLVSNTFLI